MWRLCTAKCQPENTTNSFGKQTTLLFGVEDAQQRRHSKTDFFIIIIDFPCALLFLNFAFPNSSTIAFSGVRNACVSRNITTNRIRIFLLLLFSYCVCLCENTVVSTDCWRYYIHINVCSQQTHRQMPEISACEYSVPMCIVHWWHILADQQQQQHHSRIKMRFHSFSLTHFVRSLFFYFFFLSRKCVLGQLIWYTVSY